ncbi:MAG: hypothetical protein CL607_20005 [Anaerolineaceae bacterium]|nr:hypothetical protein [Anaerolineaceae bacterium]
MFKRKVEELKQLIIDSDPNAAKLIAGCSEQTIKKIKEKQKIDYMPKAFLAYLEVMGTSSGGIFAGSDAGAQAMLAFDMNTEAKEILKEKNVIDTALDNSIVFYMHQGYVFFFIRTDEGDNPPTYMYMEEMREEDCKIEKIADSFLDFLSEFVDSWRGRFDALK